MFDYCIVVSLLDNQIAGKQGKAMTCCKWVHSLITAVLGQCCLHNISSKTLTSILFDSLCACIQSNKQRCRATAAACISNEQGAWNDNPE